MRFIKVLFLFTFFYNVCFGNRILFPKQEDYTVLSYSWVCQIFSFNFKNSCIFNSNYIKKPIKVGFLDSGVQSNLAILKSYEIKKNYNLNGEGSLIDIHGHGTQTVSVFIDTINQIERDIGESIPFEIYPVNILSNNSIDSFNLIKGYFYLSHFIKADVINLSLSGLDYSIDEAKAFQYGSKNFSSLVVVSAGNEVLNLDKSNSYPCSYQSENSICVGSTNVLGNGLISNFGYDVDVLINGEKVRVVQKEGNYNLVNGSSFSSPQITAYITYALYKNPKLNYSEIKKMVINSSYDKSLCLFSKSCGIFSFSKFKILVEQSLKR